MAKSESATSTLNRQNTEVLKNFFEMHGDDTGTILAKFLFERLKDFTQNGEWTDEYKDECLLNFSLLHDLVTELEPVSRY
jgi:hypothetical protein